MMKVKNNEVMTIDLDGPNGNAFYLLGTAQQLAKQCGLDDVMITEEMQSGDYMNLVKTCLLYTSPSPRDVEESRMPSSA